MAAPTDPAAVEDAFRKTGCGWILEMGDQRAILEQVAKDLDDFIEEYNRRFMKRPDPFALLGKNPLKATAFFETYTNPPLSLDMRIAVWRLIVGANLIAVRFEYRKDKGTELVITLDSGRRRKADEYKSENLWDFQILRHIGILSLDGTPFLDGYYASFTAG